MKSAYTERRCQEVNKQTTLFEDEKSYTPLMPDVRKQGRAAVVLARQALQKLCTDSTYEIEERQTA